MAATTVERKATPRQQIEKLAGIVSRSSDRDRLLFMFTGYFDESGTHGQSPLVVVAGYISKDEQWARLSDEWQAALDDYGLSYFHMTEFESRKGPFAPMQNPDRHRLLERLTTIIRIRQHIGIAVTFKLSDHAEVVDEFPDLPLKDPYAFSAIHCMVMARNWAKKHGYQDPIAYVYEGGAKYKGQVLSAYEFATEVPGFSEELRLGSLTFGDARRFVPLQCADLLAYETWKEVTNTIAGRPRRTRWPMNQLVRAPLSGLNIQKDQLRSYLLDLRKQIAEGGTITLRID